MTKHNAASFGRPKKVSFPLFPKSANAEEKQPEDKVPILDGMDIRFFIRCEDALGIKISGLLKNHGMLFIGDVVYRRREFVENLFLEERLARRTNVGDFEDVEEFLDEIRLKFEDSRKTNYYQVLENKKEISLKYIPKNCDFRLVLKRYGY